MASILQQQKFIDRQNALLDHAELLLLKSSNADFSLSDLALSLGVAKGTLYKHFATKDELILTLLIRNEQQLYELYQKDHPSAVMVRFILYFWLNPAKVLFYYQLEERLSCSLRFQDFYELYYYRYRWLRQILKQLHWHLQKQNSSLSPKAYFIMLWSMVQGIAILLTTSTYQNTTKKHELILSNLGHLLELPKRYPSPKPKPIPDEYSPFGKLMPPIFTQDS